MEEVVRKNYVFPFILSFVIIFFSLFIIQFFFILYSLIANQSFVYLNLFALSQVNYFSIITIYIFLTAYLLYREKTKFI